MTLPGRGTTSTWIRSPSIGGASGHRGRDVRMRGEDLLELERRDLVAAARDQLLRSPGQLDHSVFAHARHVAGAEPAILERRRGERRRIQIAVHDEGRANLQLAHLAAFGHGTIGGDDAIFDVR
jgi:hypothetical protein